MSDRERKRPASDVEALTEVLAERARESAGAEDGQPSPEELLDYLEGRLSPEAEAAMARRLVASPEATRDLLALAEMAEAGEAAEEGGREPSDVADFEVRAGWRDFQRRVRDEPDGRRGQAPARRAAMTGPNRGLAALAATLFVAVLALGVWNRQLRNADGPAANLPQANLETLELADGLRSDRVPTVELAPGEPFRVVLDAPHDRCPVYRAEIAGPGGRDAADVEPVPGLEPNEYERLDLLLHAGGPGRYTLSLFGCEPEREISSYGFEISHSGNDTPERNGAAR